MNHAYDCWISLAQYQQTSCVMTMAGHTDRRTRPSERKDDTSANLSQKTSVGVGRKTKLSLLKFG